MRSLPTALALLLLALACAAPVAALTPVDQPFRLDDGEACTESDLDLARLADGGFVAVWLQQVEPGRPERVHARLFDADGTPRGAVFAVSDDESPFHAAAPAVAAAADDGFLVAWGSSAALGASIHARPYAADGTPRTGVLDLGAGRAPEDVDAVAEGAGYRVAWTADDTTVTSRPVTADGSAGDAEVLAMPGTLLEANLILGRPRLAADAAGLSLVVHAVEEGPFARPGRFLLGVRLPAGQPFTAAVPLELPGFVTPRELDQVGVAVGTDGAGGTVVAWRQEEAAGDPLGIQVQRFAADGTALGLPQTISGSGGWSALSDVALSVAAGGAFRVAWAGRTRGGDGGGDGGDGDEGTPGEGPADGGDALYAAAFDAAGDALSTAGPLDAGSSLLPAAPSLLDLGGGGVLLGWERRVPPDAAAVAPCDSMGLYARHLQTPPAEALLLHGGRFAVQVAWDDPYSAQPRTGVGTGVALSTESGYFWFFRPGNAELVLKVHDGSLVNGHWWVFHGGLSTVAYEITVTDLVTGAVWSYAKPPFERSSAADTRAFPFTKTGAGTAAATPDGLLASARAAASTPAGPCSDPRLTVEVRPGLCLHRRFEVEVEFDDPLFQLNQGGESLSADTGRLWFFRRDNTELLVKVLDGRPVNGHWWVFSGALTNVGYTLVVRDTETAEERRYPVPKLSFVSLADVSAF